MYKIFAMMVPLMIGSAYAQTPSETPSTESAQAELETVGIDPELSVEEIEDLTKEAFYWGNNLAGFYELRFGYTQFEELPIYTGVNRPFPNENLTTAEVRHATTMNASTLYSGGNFDVSEGPIVIETPEVTDERYWSVQAVEPFASWFLEIGSQFTGNEPQRYVVTGPDWKGTLPAEFKSTEIIEAPSTSFAIAVRVAVTDRSEEDLKSARELIHGVKMGPLKLWEENGGTLPPRDEQPIVKGTYRNFPQMKEMIDYARSMTPVAFLQILSYAINDPTITIREDSIQVQETLKKLAPLGLREGVLFDPEKLTEEEVAAVEAGFNAARKTAREAMKETLIDMNGWQLQSSVFHDPTDYVAHSGATDVAWSTPVPYRSHTIAYLFNDSEGRPLEGDARYTLTLDLDNPPPVTEFWELPVYDSAGYFIDNEIDRYSVTSYMLDADKYVVKDGKVTFYFQPERPSDPEQAQNWLPTLKGDTFQLAARFYGPKAPLVDGSYDMPQLIRQDEQAN